MGKGRIPCRPNGQRAEAEERVRTAGRAALACRQARHRAEEAGLDAAVALGRGMITQALGILERGAKTPFLTQACPPHPSGPTDRGSEKDPMAV